MFQSGEGLYLCRLSSREQTAQRIAFISLFFFPKPKKRRNLPNIRKKCIYVMRISHSPALAAIAAK
jgi:hypothetical protein